jgi:cyclic beta-1,2-glucan synthetase
LDSSAERLADAYRFLSDALGDVPAVASEDWLRDNYYIVQDQIREIRQDLPRRFYLQLPKLAEGPYEGYPRVYLIARELIGHTAGRLDLEMLADFTAAYQREAPLSIGETWAIPIMLRLGLVEELQRLVDDVVAARRSRQQARKWETALAAGAARRAEDFDRLLAEEVDGTGRLPTAFVVELMQWLRDQPLSAAGAWEALRRALEAQGDAPEALVRAEHQREASDQLAIGNIVTSMRLLSSIDWPLFFDRVSVVEQVLSGDPAGAYAEMDFATRDRYRHSIEELSRRSQSPELVVATRAIEMAREAMEQDPANDRRHHVGYYLISRGRFALEEALRYRPRVRERLARFVFEHPAIGYLGTLGLATALGVSGLLAYAARHGTSTRGLWIVGLLVLLPVSELAIALLNALLTAVIRPRQLPKLALKLGIPVSARTVVVVPAIIDSASRVEALFHDLEVRFLANRDPHLHFALLSDFADAATATTPQDEALVAMARAQVDALNDRHGPDRFLLCHRERRWNVSQERWIGWERKRGKLQEFNRLLRGAGDTSFVVLHGDVSVLPSIKYVITLDSDTHLPIDAGRRLVGALSHPLNRPRFNPQFRRVTEGYGILQPRVQVSVESAARTPFAQVYSGHVGLDPYTTAVSDIYQDLFHEGTYVGKGIYDVDAFEAALESRVPENALLSHDLFEGLYARAGLCTDIDVVDDYPANYLAFASRQHRWVRGDWQIRPMDLADRARQRRPSRRQPPAGRLPLEDSGQPASQPAGPGARRAVDCRLDVAPRIDDGLVGTGADGAGLSRVHAGGPFVEQPRPRHPAARTRARRARQRRRRRQPGVPGHRLPAASERADARRHHPDAGPLLYPAPDARVGDRRPWHADGSLASRAAASHAADSAGRRRDRAPGRCRRSSAARHCASCRPAVGGLSAAGVRDGTIAVDQRHRPHPHSAGGVPARGAQDVALLRRSRHVRRSLADSRQHPGRPARVDRAPHVPDQHRAAAAVDAGGL